MDIPLFFDKPLANEAFNNSDIAKQYKVATNQLPSTKVLWSPRVGFRWNPDEDRRTLVRGGIGIFTGRIPFVWISNSFTNTGIEVSRTSFNFRNMPQIRPDGFHFNIDPSKQYESPGTSEVNVVDKDFKYPSVFRANLAVEHTLPYDIRVSLEGLYSKTLNNILYENINYQHTGSLNNGGDNRPTYKQVDANFTQIMYLTNTNKGYTYNITAKVEKPFDFGLNAMVAYSYGQAKSLTDGNSSQAYSGWKYNPVYGGDVAPELSWSMFDVRNRIVASVSYTKEYAGHFATTVSLFYNGQTGGRYSLLYSNDINGDGYGNDLLYIPTDAEREKMLFTDIVSNGKVTSTAAEQKDAFVKWIEGNKDIRDTKGDHIKRNQLVMPFEHHFDFHIAQNFFMNVAGRRHTLQVNFDILNVGNLFNKKWGLYHQTSTGYDLTPVAAFAGKDGQFTYQFRDPGDMYTNTAITSRWQAQIGLRYIF